MIRENIKAILEDDFEVIEAINGETAVKLLTAPGAKEKIHAVLLDIMLPDISGVEVLSEIRNSYKHAFPCNRVIMLTAYDDPKFIDTAVGVRAADYLVKGVNFEAKSLIEKLRIITDREYYTAAFEELIAVLAEQRQV
jgi:DNA-binding NarL/FixJ family response regulator